MSRRLAALETRLGVRLVSRTTRSFELTAEGSLFHERCLCILEEIDEAEAEAAAGGIVPRGLLRIGVPLEIGRRRIAPLVAEFVGLHPKVEAHLALSDAILDVVGDALDVVLYIGTPPEQGLIATKILSSDLLVCAAPAYLARRGTPRIPARHPGARVHPPGAWPSRARPLDVHDRRRTARSARVGSAVLDERRGRP